MKKRFAIALVVCILMAGCTDTKSRSTGVYMLLDTSGTYAVELKKAQLILNYLLESPDFGRYDLSSLNCITYGAAPMPPALLKEGIEKIGPVFMQDYGASEAGALTILDIEDHVVDGPPEQVKRLASCGKPIPGVSVQVLNEKGEEVKPGEIGELTTKSPMVIAVRVPIRIL